MQGAIARLLNQSWYLYHDLTAANEGLTRNNPPDQYYTPKESFYAMKTVAQEVGDGTYLGASCEGVQWPIQCYKFRPQGSKLGSHSWVLWDESGTSSYTVPASTSPRLVQVLNVLGTPTPFTRGSSVSVQVGVDPVYLEWQRFEDVALDSHWWGYVEYLASRGIIAGYTADYTFRPGNSITRGQLAKVIVLGMYMGNLPLNDDWKPVDASPSSPVTFSDVPKGSPFYSFIERAAQRGIIGGYADGTFRPGNSATRGQIAKMMVLAKGWPRENPSIPRFSDVPTTHTFYTYIETAAVRQITSGYADGTFGPGNNATRGQASKMWSLALCENTGSCP